MQFQIVPELSSPFVAGILPPKYVCDWRLQSLSLSDRVPRTILRWDCSYQGASPLGGQYDAYIFGLHKNILDVIGCNNNPTNTGERPCWMQSVSGGAGGVLPHTLEYFYKCA